MTIALDRLPPVEVDVDRVPELVGRLARPEVRLRVGAPQEADEVLAGDADAEGGHEHGQQRRGPGVAGERAVDAALDHRAGDAGDEDAEHGGRPERQAPHGSRT